jgi:hypothetical protein
VLQLDNGVRLGGAWRAHEAASRADADELRHLKLELARSAELHTMAEEDCAAQRLRAAEAQAAAKAAVDSEAAQRSSLQTLQVTIASVCSIRKLQLVLSCRTLQYVHEARSKLICK